MKLDIPITDQSIDYLNNSIFPFFTDDTGLFEEYEEVRRTCYKEMIGLPTMEDTPNLSVVHYRDLLVVTYYDVVIGGGKIVGRFPGDTHTLPMEDESFLLPEIFPGFNLNENPYCEFTRLSLLPAVRSQALLHWMFIEMVSFAIAKGYKYIFSVASLRQARCNRLGAKSIGLPNEYKIYKNYEMPNQQKKYGDYRAYLSSLELPLEWRGIKNQYLKF